MTENIRIGVLRSWQEPSRRWKQREAIQDLWLRPGYRARQVEVKRAQWADPVWRAKTSAAIKRGKAR